MAALQKVPLKFPIQSGLDTRTSDFELDSPKLAALDNGFLSDPKTVSKRNGYAPLTTSSVSSTAAAIYTRASEMVLVDSTKVTPLVPGLGAFASPTPVAGSTSSFPPVATEQGTIAKFLGTNSMTGAVCHGQGYYLAAANSITGSGVDARIIDDSTLSVVSATTSLNLHGGGGTPFIFRMGTGFQVIGWDSTTTQIATFNFTVGTQPYPTPGSKIITISDLGSNQAFDVADYLGGFRLVAYQSSTALTIKYGTIDVSGTFTSLGTQATAAEASHISVAVDSSTGNFAISWCMQGATMRVDSRMYNSSGTALFAAQTVSTGVPAPLALNGVTSSFQTSSFLDIFFNHSVAAGLAVYYSGLTSGGVASTPVVFSFAAQLSSKAWVQPGFGSVSNVVLATAGNGSTGIGIWVASSSALGQGTYYLCRGASGGPTNYVPSVVATAFPGSAVQTVQVAGVGVLLAAPQVDGNAAIMSLASLDATGKGTVQTVSWRFGVDHGGVEVGSVLYLPGGVTRIYDGRTISEVTPLRFPEGATASSSSSGGSLLASTSYHYFLAYEYVGANGEVVQSASVEDVSITTGVSDNAVTVACPTLQLTDRTDISISVYRREQGGLNYHLVSTRTPNASGHVSNSFTARTQSFLDLTSEANLVKGELLPQSEDITDNVPPPPCTLVASGNGRVFLSGFADPDLIWYSKLRETGEAVQFTDVNTIVVETGVGPITAMGCIGDSLVIFRGTQIYICGGDGLDNTGTTGSFTTPRLISEGIGCSNPRSIVTVGNALYFQSRKGIYSLDGTGTLSYVGADVEMYNAETVTSAVAVSSANQLRFTTSARTLVYDYELKAWFHWTIGAAGAVLWNGKHVLLPGSTSLTLIETPGTYLDNNLPYTMAIEFPWITPGDPGSAQQGRCRLYWANFLGTYLGPHQALIKFGYDYEPAFAEQHTWTPSAVLQSGPGSYGGANYGTGVYGGTAAGLYNASQSYQFTVRTARQKCQSFKCRIEDQAAQGSGPLGNSFSLAEASFVIGVRPTVPAVGVERRR